MYLRAPCGVALLLLPNTDNVAALLAERRTAGDVWNGDYEWVHGGIKGGPLA